MRVDGVCVCVVCVALWCVLQCGNEYVACGYAVRVYVC